MDLTSKYDRYIHGKVVDGYGNTITSWEKTHNLFLKVDLDAGETYYLGIKGNDDYVFALCYPEKNIHPQNDLYVNISGASCTKAGLQFSFCQYCGEIASERETAPATGHTPDDWVIEEPATCTEDGLYVQRCTVCNEIIDSQVIEKTYHVPGTEETLRTASCLSDGLRSQYCTVCNETLNTEIIPSLGHSVVAYEEPSTCIAAGKKSSKQPVPKLVSVYSAVRYATQL